MNHLTTHPLLLLASAATVVAVAGLTVTIAWAAGITFEGGQPEPAEGRADYTEPPGSSSVVAQGEPGWVQDPGDNAGGAFSFCIDTVGLSQSGDALAVVRGEAKNAVDSAIRAARDDPLWSKTGLESSLPATYVESCPQPPLPSVTNGEWRDGVYHGGYGEFDERFNEDTWSPYNFFVFVMPLKEIDGLLGGTSQRMASQELERYGDLITPISVGIYLTPEEISEDPEFVVETMKYALGLRY